MPRVSARNFISKPFCVLTKIRTNCSHFVKTPSLVVVLFFSLQLLFFLMTSWYSYCPSRDVWQWPLVLKTQTAIQALTLLNLYNDSSFWDKLLDQLNILSFSFSGLLYSVCVATSHLEIASVLSALDAELNEAGYSKS